MADICYGSVLCSALAIDYNGGFILFVGGYAVEVTLFTGFAGDGTADRLY